MRRRRRAREGQEKRKRANRRPILKKLCAALLRSFRGQHSEKMKGSARGNWNPREGQQPFRPNPNGAGDRTTTLRRLLIGADMSAFVRSNFFKTAGRTSNKLACTPSVVHLYSRVSVIRGILDVIIAIFKVCVS